MVACINERELKLLWRPNFWTETNAIEQAKITKVSDEIITDEISIDSGNIDLGGEIEDF